MSFQCVVLPYFRNAARTRLGPWNLYADNVLERTLFSLVPGIAAQEWRAEDEVSARLGAMLPREAAVLRPGLLILTAVVLLLTLQAAAWVHDVNPKMYVQFGKSSQFNYTGFFLRANFFVIFTPGGGKKLHVYYTSSLFCPRPTRAVLGSFIIDASTTIDCILFILLLVGGGFCWPRVN